MQFTSMTEYIKGSSHNATTIYDNTRLGRIEKLNLFYLPHDDTKSNHTFFPIQMVASLSALQIQIHVLSDWHFVAF